MPSVLQDWVTALPLRHQGTLLTCVRGCDLAPKDAEHLMSPERHIVAWLRWTFMVPADEREVSSEPGCWMRREPPEKFRWSSVSHYPGHWIGHVIHALEVVAYHHPDTVVATAALELYCSAARNLHMVPEQKWQLDKRLTEDRVATGTIVS